MKIAVLTRRYGYNFGSSLQACAIRLMLENLGHDVAVLNYDEFSQHVLWKVKPKLRSLIVPFLSICGKLGLKNHHVLSAITEKSQRERFLEFDRLYIKPNKDVLHNRRTLSKAVKGYDACICGSDQIWNPNSFDTHYYLDFCSKDEIRKISYAASFGIPMISDKVGRISSFLNDFSFISVREMEGKQIVENISGRRDCSVVLDPTIMVSANEWRQLKSKSRVDLPDKYVVCYFLGNTYIPHKWIETVAARLNCPIVNLTTFRTRNEICGAQLDTLGPLDFLSVIDNATCVLTDSFHATVFSILFEKEFFSFNKHKNESAVNENSRLYTLLEKLQLGDRHVVDNEVIPSDFPSISYKEVKEALGREKRLSNTFLMKALSF